MARSLRHCAGCRTGDIEGDWAYLESGRHREIPGAWSLGCWDRAGEASLNSRSLGCRSCSCLPDAHLLCITDQLPVSIDRQHAHIKHTLTPSSSPQKIDHQPTKTKEHHRSSPEDPLILLRPSLHHPNRIPRNTQCISHTIQLLLRALQNLPLLP